jgi:hypothetical protein
LRSKSFRAFLLILSFLSFQQEFSCAQEPPQLAQIRTASCQRDLSILSVPEIRALTREERGAFLKAREEDAQRLALELTALLTDDVSEQIFELEKKLGLAPGQKLSRTMTIEEIARRLVAITSNQHIYQK